MEESVEVAAARVPRADRRPTEPEKEHHLAMGHAVYRNWCQACLMARGIGQPHDAAGPDRPDADPIVSTDYGFMGGEDADALEGAHVLLVA
eukprot:8793983-Heterocapsa_arctica.AAC.1